MTRSLRLSKNMFLFIFWIYIWLNARDNIKLVVGQQVKGKDEAEKPKTSEKKDAFRPGRGLGRIHYGVLFNNATTKRRCLFKC